MTRPIFQELWKEPEVRDRLKSIAKLGAITGAASFSNLALIRSHPILGFHYAKAMETQGQHIQ